MEAGPSTPASNTWKCFRWQLDCVSLHETLWEKLGKVHIQNRHLVSVTSGNTRVEAPDSKGKTNPSDFLYLATPRRGLSGPHLKTLKSVDSGPCPLAEDFSPNPYGLREEGQIEPDLRKTDINRTQHHRQGTEESQ